MAHTKKPSSPPIPIGNCEVVVEAKSFKSELDQNTLQISLSKNVNVKITGPGLSICAYKLLPPSLFAENKSEKNHDDPHNHVKGGRCIGNLQFVLINSKDADSQAQSQLEDVLNLYAKELPAMNFAANTGKQSTFLKRCVSNGKYCTLLLKSKSIEDSGEVIAAITYQIIPADTRHAEVPLAAVSSTYQRKGIGTLIYRELSSRLQSVGISTVFCWGDTESEGFWFKQGFVSIGEVDKKGKARRLRIKADIRKALCFPGGSTLLVSHINRDKLVNCEKPLNTGLQDERETEVSQPAGNQIEPRTEHSLPRELVEKGEKKRVWESSCTSLKSKKVKGGYQFDNLDSKNAVKNDGSYSFEDKSSSDLPESRSFLDARGSFSSSYFEKTAEVSQPLKKCETQDYGSNGLISRRRNFTIMLMNIADDAKKSNLSKIIEDLGGVVTSDGSLSTHVVTGKVRKTLNFCTALCSGAWIVSPSWLKESCRKGKFVEEGDFILRDEDYESKYRIELKDAVQRARNRPRALLNNYKICLAAHLQSPVHNLSAIVISAGGDVICGLAKVEVSDTIFLASEKDMEEAMCAMNKGIRTFSCDWFMNCIMTQELDFDAPQFAESL